MPPRYEYEHEPEPEHSLHTQCRRQTAGRGDVCLSLVCLTHARRAQPAHRRRHVPLNKEQK